MRSNEGETVERRRSWARHQAPARCSGLLYTSPRTRPVDRPNGRAAGRRTTGRAKWGWAAKRPRKGPEHRPSQARAAQVGLGGGRERAPSTGRARRGPRKWGWGEAAKGPRAPAEPGEGRASGAGGRPRKGPEHRPSQARAAQVGLGGGRERAPSTGRARRGPRKWGWGEAAKGPRAPAEPGEGRASGAGAPRAAFRGSETEREGAPAAPGEGPHGPSGQN